VCGMRDMRASVAGFIALLLIAAGGFETQASTDDTDAGSNEADSHLIKLVSAKDSKLTPSEVSSLLANGASPSAIGDYNYTALMWSIVRHTSDVSRLLVERGADLERVNAWGRNALFLAAWEGEAATIDVMLEHRANASSCAAHDEWTALHKAVEMGHTRIVQSLLDAGVDPSARTLPDKSFTEGVTPLMLANGRVSNHDQIRAMLNERLGLSKDEL